jgi:hypothetical protein
LKVETEAVVKAKDSKLIGNEEGIRDLVVSFFLGQLDLEM